MTSRTRFLLLLLLFASALGTLHAQTNSASGAEQPSATAATSSTADVATTSTPIVEYAPPPAEYARAKAYSNTRYRHFFINALYGFLLLLVVLRWRLAPAFRNLAERVSARRGLQLIVFAPLILVTLAVLGIPSDIWDQSLQRAYGLSVQGWGPWLLTGS